MAATRKGVAWLLHAQLHAEHGCTADHTCTHRSSRPPGGPVALLSPASHMAALSGNNDDGDGVSDDVVSVAAAECTELSAS